LGTNAPPGNSPHADTPNPVWERATTTVSLPSIYGEREGGEFSTTNFRPSYIIVLLYLFPRSGQGFSFFQDQFLAEGAGFFAKPVLENFSSTGFDFSSPSPLPNKHNKKYSPPRKSGFWQGFLFPLGGVCHPRAARSGRQTLPQATKTLPKPTIFSVRNY